MIKIIHIITGLGSGGAENMLYKLLKYSDKEKYYHEVISLMDEGTMGDKIKSEGIKVHSLNISKTNLISSLFKAKRLCQDFDIVNTWLYHADFIGFMIAKILLKKKLIWNIRHSNLDKDANKKTTLFVVKMNALFSKSVDCITYNSYKAKDTHSKVGYLSKKSKTIHNGFELDRFQFNPNARIKVRGALSIKGFEKVIITVGRWDIQKDYFTLFDALSEVDKKNINFKLIMVGTDLDSSNEILMGLINKNNLQNKVILLGRRNDIPELLSASDFYVSSSLGESFSNAIGEAMACELPCVVTDVGDSKIIVGELGLVVNAKDKKKLANALIQLTGDDFFSREKIGDKCRGRILDNYSIDKIVIQCERLYDEIKHKI